MFNRQLILLATPRQIGVLDWRPGRLRWLGEYASNATGLQDFGQVVARHAHLPACVVVDSVDEDYRGENLPHVQGQARQAMVARKLKQAFRNAHFAGAWRQARDAGGRRDDRYLFAALTDNDWLMPWLNILHREGAPLAGITPMAMAYQHLLARLRGQETHVLMACHLHNSLRLSYYQDGMLRFSRLIGGDTPTQFHGNAADEIAKTQLYLSSQRILPRDARLHVLLIDPTAQLDGALAALNADPAFSARVVGAAELARALRVPDDFLLGTTEIVPLVAIAGKPLLLNLAPASYLQRHVDYRWRRGLHAAASGIAMAGLIATATFLLHAESHHERTRQLNLQTQLLDARYQAIARTFPRQDIEPEQLAQTVGLAQTLERPGIDPRALMAAVSAALDAAPEVNLEELGWTEEGAAAPSGKASIRLAAALVPFDGNYRAAMQRIEGFMQTLARVPSLGDVRLQASPINTDPASTLSGETRNTGAAAPLQARFRLGMRYAEATP